MSQARKPVLVIAVAVFVAVVVVTLAFAVRQELQADDGGDAVAGTSAAPAVTRPSSEPLTPCESDVVQMFSRYTRVAVAGGDTGLLIGEEQMRYGLNSPSFTAYKVVLTDFVTMASSREPPWTGVGTVMSRLRPKIRYWCERYGG